MIQENFLFQLNLSLFGRINEFNFQWHSESFFSLLIFHGIVLLINSQHIYLNFVTHVAFIVKVNWPRFTTAAHSQA